MSRWSIPFVCLVIGGIAGGFIADRALHGQNSKPISVPKDVTSYREIVKQVLPAVVSIETRIKPKKVNQPKRRAPLDENQVPEQFRQFFKDLNQAPFDFDEGPNLPQSGFGSGFLVDPSGVIVTNLHVVKGADEVEVKLADGRKFVSKEIKGDSKTDLAIVRLESKEKLPFLDMGDSDAAEIGDRVLAVGAPFGLTGSVTHGIVSAKGRNGLNMNFYEDFIQTDAAINPGNSGGPLINMEGKVIGINTAIKSKSGGFQGVGLAIASNLAKTVKDQLLKDGTVRRGYLGVQIKELEPEVAVRLGVKEKVGVVIGQVFENSPAAKGGLKAGDVITALADNPIKDGKQLQRIVAGLPIDKKASVSIVRDGKPLALDVTILEQPEDLGSARVPTPREAPRQSNSINMEKVGLEMADMTAEMAEQMGFKESMPGAMILQVEPNSAAAEAGLRRGMLVQKVEKAPVASATEAKNALEKSDLVKGTLLQVYSPRGGTDYLVLKAK